MDRIFFGAQGMQAALDPEAEGRLDFAGVIAITGQFMMTIPFAEQDEFHSMALDFLIAGLTPLAQTQEDGTAFPGHFGAQTGYRDLCPGGSTVINATLALNFLYANLRMIVGIISRTEQQINELVFVRDRHKQHAMPVTAFQ